MSKEPLDIPKLRPLPLWQPLRITLSASPRKSPAWEVTLHTVSEKIWKIQTSRSLILDSLVDIAISVGDETIFHTVARVGGRSRDLWTLEMMNLRNAHWPMIQSTLSQYQKRVHTWTQAVRGHEPLYGTPNDQMTVAMGLASTDLERQFSQAAPKSRIRNIIPFQTLEPLKNHWKDVHLVVMSPQLFRNQDSLSILHWIRRESDRPLTPIMIVDHFREIGQIISWTERGADLFLNIPFDEKMLEHAFNSLASHRTDAPALESLKKAMQSLRQGQWLEARQTLLNASPTAHAYYLLGTLALKEGRPQHALDFFFRALELHPFHIKSLISRAHALKALGDHGNYRISLEHLLPILPSYPTLLTDYLTLSTTRESARTGVQLIDSILSHDQGTLLTTEIMTECLPTFLMKILQCVTRNELLELIIRLRQTYRKNKEWWIAWIRILYDLQLVNEAMIEVHAFEGVYGRPEDLELVYCQWLLREKKYIDCLQRLSHMEFSAHRKGDALELLSQCYSSLGLHEKSESALEQLNEHLKRAG